MKLQIFSTPVCHLCSLAKAIVTAYVNSDSNTNAEGIELEVIDIINNADLLKRYGESIPVVKEVMSEAELYWPFDDEQFARWVNELPA